MGRNKHLLRMLLLVGLLLPLVSTRQLPAGFSKESLHMHVEIDGVDFGTFDQDASLVDRMDEAAANKDHPTSTFQKISLKRDFVTDRSLYLWATQAMRLHTGLRDIHLVMKNGAGDEVNRYVMKLCQPLSWSVEAANPALGGFHETVDFAVQGISSF